jgi:hypothetical protein
MLVQVMTEEQASGFETEPADGGVLRIKNIGRDPWRVKQPAGTVRFTRADAAGLRITTLDLNGRRTDRVATGATLSLAAETLYYLIEAP